MEVKIHGDQFKEKIDRGDPVKAQIYLKPPINTTMSNSWKASPQQVIQKLDDDRAWSSQEWKTDTEMYKRSGRPDETSWRATREIRPGFSHEETLHDGTAQSVVNEVIPRDRSGRPDIDSQEGAWPQQFVIGNDEAELELSVESRSFVNRVNDQVRKRQKKFPTLQGDGEEHFMIWGMFMAVTMEISSIHGSEFPKQ